MAALISICYEKGCYLPQGKCAFSPKVRKSPFRRNTQFPSEGAALPGAIPGVGWSDHWAFWQCDYAAVMVTDTLPYRYRYYHEPTDTAEHLDFDRMARVVDGMQSVIEEFAGAEMR